MKLASTSAIALVGLVLLTNIGCSAPVEDESSSAGTGGLTIGTPDALKRLPDIAVLSVEWIDNGVWVQLGNTSNSTDITTPFVVRAQSTINCGAIFGATDGIGDTKEYVLSSMAKDSTKWVFLPLAKGPGFVFVRADVTNAVLERSEANNSNTSAEYGSFCIK